jgi:hypothetical protein
MRSVGADLDRVAAGRNRFERSDHSLPMSRQGRAGRTGHDRGEWCTRPGPDGPRRTGLDPYVVLGTIDEDGRNRTSPVYFTPHGYEDLYWISNRGTHHSQNLHRDARLSGVVFDSSRPPGQTSAVYVTGMAHEVPDDELEQHLPVA